MRIPIDRNFWTVVALVILAGALRLPTLGSPLIEDEAISFNRYIDVPWRELILTYHDTNQHTFFILLSKLCLWIFGESEAIFRLPSFLAGVLAVPLIYRLGQTLRMSWPAAVTAAGLLAFSWPHLKYSLEGRGYGLTMLLVIAATFFAIRYLEGSRRLWGSALVGTGFAMAVTLPSNLFFLGGLAVFAVLAAGFEFRETGTAFKQMLRASVPFLITFALVGGYFLIIYEGLKSGLDHHPLPLDAPRIMRIAEFLVAPWGLWMYLFFMLGVWRLNRLKERIVFAAILMVPVLLTLATGVVGFARTYVYGLPFILLLSALGMTEAFGWLRGRIGKAVYGFGAVFVFLLASFPAQKMAEHYSARVHGSLVVGGPNATLSEAKQVATWVEGNVPKDHLVVLMAGGPESSVLNRYLGKTVLERMSYFVRGGELKKLVFIAHREVPPQDYPLIPLFKERPLRLPADRLKVIHAFGNLKVYEWGLKVARFIPPRFDPDYEERMGLLREPEIDTAQVEHPKVFGRHALYIGNKTGRQAALVSPVIKGVDIYSSGAYVLFVYIKGYHQKTSAYLAEKGVWPPTIGYLNPYLGIFRTKEGGIPWHIVYSLSPISKGRHYLQEWIDLVGEDHYVDGFQSFLLTG